VATGMEPGSGSGARCAFSSRTKTPSKMGSLTVASPGGGSPLASGGVLGQRRLVCLRGRRCDADDLGPPHARWGLAVSGPPALPPRPLRPACGPGPASTSAFSVGVCLTSWWPAGPRSEGQNGSKRVNCSKPVRNWSKGVKRGQNRSKRIKTHQNASKRSRPGEHLKVPGGFRSGSGNLLTSRW